jgi:two-component system, NarL family, response regulator
MTQINPITVLIVEDHPVVRFGLVALIDSQPDMNVVAETGEGREAIQIYSRLLPSLAVVDLRLPDLSGVDVIAGITRAHPDARIVVLTTYEGDEDIHRALAAGARGYVIKAMPHDVLLTAMRTVHAGGHSIPKPVATALASRVPFAELTSRETQILELITRGMSNKEIADSTGITEGTVKGHVNVILGKLGATHRTQAEAIAIRRGIVHL